MASDLWYNTAGNKHQKCVAHIGSGFFFSSGSHSQIKTGGTADTKHQAEGNAGGCQRKSNIRGSIAKKTNALADKQLVDNVVKRADQHGNNTWNSKLAQQLSDGLVRHRVSSCCHKRFLISFKNFGAAKKVYHNNEQMNSSQQAHSRCPTLTAVHKALKDSA